MARHDVSIPLSMDAGELSRLLLKTVTVLKHTSWGPESHRSPVESVKGSQELYPSPTSSPPRSKHPPRCLCFGLLKTFSKLTLASWPEL